MGDMRFLCTSCGQPLVVDRSGVGLPIDCPSCQQSIQIPCDSNPDDDRRTREIVSTWSDRVAALKAEAGQLTSRVAATETARTKSDAAFHEVSADLIKARKLIETLQAECKQSACEAERLSSEIGPIRAEMEAIQKTHSEAAALIERQRSALTENENRNATLQTERDVFEKDLAGVKATLAANRKETAALREEYARLCTEIAQNHDLAESIELRREKEKLDRELQSDRATLADTTQKLEASERQCSALRDRGVELELKLAATREASSESQLAQDNEVLRRLVERINEELKERSPAPAKSRASLHGLTSSIAALSRSLAGREV